MASIFRNGKFIELPDSPSDECLARFLDMAGLIDETERMMRDPRLANEAKLEREAMRAEKKRIQKEAIELSKKEFQKEYDLLSKLSLDEHNEMHTNVCYDLENNYDPECIDQRSVPETDTNCGLPYERISNNCMCFRCRRENYSDQDHQRWMSEQEEARIAEKEREKTKKATDIATCQAKIRKLRAAEKVAAEQRVAESLLSQKKIAQMRQNQILPTGWTLNTSTKFPGKYFQYRHLGRQSVSLWETKTDNDGNVAFGWVMTPSRQIIDIYSETVIDTLSEMELLNN